ncbi:hypothetical protein PIROE2DRAFT_3448 [Piromyces sp. E2]|nr:hypothetical protein PIROE2DRAFT_3448 [Piromyces sp. E2]|eukprot:OUM68761.1 hypothetical protein PIROE2DRAFT_3448 [Piromyces sp. E2]
MIRLLVDLNLQQYGTSLDDYLRERYHIYKDDPNSYHDQLKPILKSTHMAYVFPNEHYDQKKSTLDVHRLKYEYNPKPRDEWKLDIVTHMVFNEEDIQRGFVVYPYPLKKLADFYKKKNISAEVFLVRTKYHTWDDINANNGVTCVSELFGLLYKADVSKRDERLAVVINILNKNDHYNNDNDDEKDADTDNSSISDESNKKDVIDSNHEKDVIDNNHEVKMKNKNKNKKKNKKRNRKK